jgi:hypothetical protein
VKWDGNHWWAGCYTTTSLLFLLGCTHTHTQPLSYVSCHPVHPVPQLTGQLPALERMFIRYTGVSGPLACGLVNSTALHTLSISGNAATGSVPDCFLSVRVTERGGQSWRVATDVRLPAGSLTAVCWSQLVS